MVRVMNFIKELIPDNGDEEKKWESISGALKNYQLDGYITTDFRKKLEDITEKEPEKVIKFVLPYTTRYAKIISSLYKLRKISETGSKKMDDIKKYFKESILSKMKTDLIDDKFDYYARTLRACLKYQYYF